MNDTVKEEILDEEDNTPEVSSLEMSDEDFAKSALPDEPAVVENEAQPGAEDGSSEEPEPTPEGAEGDPDGSNKDPQENEPEAAAEEAAEEKTPEELMKEAFSDQFSGSEEGSAPAAKKADEGKKTEKKESKPEVKDSAEEKEVSEINYKAEYEKLLTPFRANGKDMSVQSVDDALTLMKMGANYNKKMAGLKPNLKLMKMLGNNDLLDEEKLTYLIDLQKKNPEAIAKFIKDSGIDPLDIDTEKDTEYKPGTYTVDDSEVELDAVLAEIQDTKAFDETIDIISNKWDDSSKKVVLAEPKLISVINGHVESGIYGKISEIVENERMLGRLTELSDLEAYKHVGDLLQKNGAFDKVVAKEPEATTPTAEVVQTPTKAKGEDPKLKNRRRAASSPKGVPSKGAPTFNPLAMSDEEFEKASANIGI